MEIHEDQKKYRFMSQSQYLHMVLKGFGLLDTKHVFIPHAVNFKLSPNCFHNMRKKSSTCLMLAKLEASCML